eukprot:TRINITY_DN10838_c0_g5_i1.p1 TRINITY_DN10838_c0_g5~~TRINITY_DN10838_c0_g5_i1.p1  ORF type:complete len:396 (-),score=68.11 TRINITY_DN10838_c0_g5_i1:331-1518(-)
MLLLASKELAEYKVLNAVKSVKLAGYLVRLSFTGANGQEELEYIKRGLDVLNEINYADIDVTQHREEIKALANALNTYAEKWSKILSDDKETLLNAMKEQNRKLYNEFIRLVHHREPVSKLRDVEKNLKKHLNSDIVFKGILEKLKQKISEIKQDNLVNEGKNMRDKLRSALNSINLITGLPADVIINRDEWRLEKVSVFSEENDQCRNSQAGFRILGQLLENFKVSANCTPKDFDLVSLLINYTGRYNRAPSNLLEIKSESPINSTSVQRIIGAHYKRRSRGEYPSALYVLQQEKGVTKVISILAKALKATLAKIKKSCTAKANSPTRKPIRGKLIRSSLFIKKEIVRSDSDSLNDEKLKNNTTEICQRIGTVHSSFIIIVSSGRQGDAGQVVP